MQFTLAKNNRRDILHLDSAYKGKVDCFLTSDKGDICRHYSKLEILLGFKIFHLPSQLEELRLFLSS
jgi:hypothetical protein